MCYILFVTIFTIKKCIMLTRVGFHPSGWSHPDGVLQLKTVYCLTLCNVIMNKLSSYQGKGCWLLAYGHACGHPQLLHKDTGMISHKGLSVSSGFKHLILKAGLLNPTHDTHHLLQLVQKEVTPSHVSYHDYCAAKSVSFLTPGFILICAVYKKTFRTINLFLKTEEKKIPALIHLRLFICMHIERSLYQSEQEDSGSRLEQFILL